MNIHMCKGLRLMLNTLFTHSPSSFYFIAEQCILITPAPLSPPIPSMPFPNTLVWYTHKYISHTNHWECVKFHTSKLILFSDKMPCFQKTKNALGGMVLGPERQLNRVKLLAMQAWQAYFKPQSTGKGCCYELKDKNSHPCYRPNIQVTFQRFHTGH